MKGKITRARNVFVALTLAMLFGGLVAGCGDGDNFTTSEEPFFAINGFSGNTFALDLSNASDRHASQGRTIQIRNTGGADLKLNMEWVGEKPERLVVDKARMEQSCSSDNECGSEGICLTSGSCRETGLPEVGHILPPNQRYDLNFYVKRGQGELNCPTPDDNVPSELSERYCGQLLITTNATNNSGIVEEGSARIYFTTDGRSGQIVLEPQFIQFTNARPGESQSQQFTISNTGSQPLLVSRADVHTHAQYFTISPSIYDVSVPSFGAETYTLTFNPPATAQAGELAFTSKIVFETNSLGSNSREILIEVTEGSGSSPIIEVDPEALSFGESDEQSLTISNLGNATLQLTGLSVQPRAVEDYYRFFLDGTDITDAFPSPRPVLTRASEQDGEVVPETMELVVKFIPPEDDSISTVGTLQIRHNDMSVNNLTEVMLLGDAEGSAIGEAIPSFITFFANAGEEDARHFVIRNRGSSDLEITDVVLDAAEGSSADDFSVEGIIGTVPAGGIKQGVVNYSGTSATTNSVNATIISNTVGAQDDMSITFVSQPGPAAPTVDPSVQPSFTSSALVGENTTLTVSDASNEANLSHAVWLLLERPAASSVFFEHTGSSVSFVPDAAGSYKVGVTLYNATGHEVQEVFEFSAEE